MTAFEDRAREGETRAETVSGGRLVNRSAALQARREEFATRTSTVYDWSSLCAAPPVQLRKFDDTVGDLHDAVGVANHKIYGDPHPVVFYGPTLQRRARDDERLAASRAHAVAADGLSGAATRLPHFETIQRSFGAHDVSHVQAHVDGKAQAASRQLHAHGYASGDAVAFASQPDLFTAAHEAAHIVQQRAGVALSDGLGRAGDVYERHADEVAGLVVRGQSAEGALSRMVGAGRGASPSRAVQLDSKGGGFRQWFAETFGGKEEPAAPEVAEPEPPQAVPEPPKATRQPHWRTPNRDDAPTPDDLIIEETETYVGGRDAIVDVDENGVAANRYRRVHGTHVLDETDGDKATTGSERYERVEGGTKTTVKKREVGPKEHVDTESTEVRRRDRVETAKRAQAQLVGRRDALEFLANELKGRSPNDAATKARLAELESERRRIDTLIERLDDPEQLERVAVLAEALPGAQRFEWEERQAKREVKQGTASQRGRTEHFEEHKTEARAGNIELEKSERSASFHGVDEENLGYSAGSERLATRKKTVVDPDGDGFDRVDVASEGSSDQRGWNLAEGANASRSASKSVARADGSKTSWSAQGGMSAEQGLYNETRYAVRSKEGYGFAAKGRDTLDRQGATTHRDATLSKDGDHWSAKGRVSGDGSFSVVVKPVKADAEGPARYEVVTTIKVAVGNGLDADATAQRKDGRTYRDNDARASVSGGASASATYTHTRVLSVAEAKAYLAEVDRVEASGKSGSLPEFDTWSKVKAWAKEDGSLRDVAGAFGSGKTARAMKTGDSVSFELEGRVEGSGKAGLGMVDAGASTGGGVKRTVTVKRLEDGFVEICVDLASDHDWGVDGGAKIGLVSGKVGHRAGSSSGRAVTFRLNGDAPEYEAKFARIGKALSLEELESLRRAFDAEVTSDKRSKGEHEGTSGNVAIGTEKLNVGFDVGDGTFGDEAIDTKGESKIRGGSHAGAHVGVQTPLGKVSVGEKTTETGIAQVDESGDLSIEIVEEKKSSGLSTAGARREGEALGEGVNDAVARGKERVGKGAVPSAHDVVRGVEGAHDTAEAARSKMAKAAELLAESDTELRSIGLTQADVTALTGRARSSEPEWQRHAAWSGPAAFNAWLGLRGQLLRPKVETSDVAEAGQHKAEQLARGRAVQAFVKGAGGSGRIIMESALRNWGAGSFGGGARHAELGHAQAFPKSIAKLGDRGDETGEWSKWHQDVAAFGAKLDAFAKTPDGMAKAQALVTSLSDRGDALRRAIEGAGDFEEPRVRAEMLARLSVANEKRRSQYQAFMVERATAAGERVDLKHFSEENARRRVGEIVGILVGLKQDEARLVQAVKAELSSWVVDWNEALTMLGRVQASYDFWVARIRELRALHAQRGTPPAAWRVSEGPGKPRRKDTEPDVDQLYVLFKHGERDVEALKRVEAMRQKYSSY